ncbi:GGDEF domain-containing protein [Devosia sp. 2618]|uniref:GGDEF domain-containing protein n=1 Tax=Devosia sp. 2618 TaxID=3156454 RepID=UPI0033996D17
MSVAFLLLWQGRRGHFYVLLAGAGHLATAIGFLIQDVMPPLPLEMQRIPSNAFFLLAAAFLMGSLIRHYRLDIPWRGFAIISAFGMAALCWFLLVQPSLNMRIICVSFALSAMALLAVLELRKVRQLHKIDHVIFWACLLSAINFLLRPTVIIMIDGGYSDYVGFQQSLYWSTVQFTQALISVVLALSLMVAIAMQLLDKLQSEARTDTLSGLLNRRGFEEDGETSLARSVAAGAPAALLLADLDLFKQINDHFGHVAGDAVISRFGQIVQQHAPDGAVHGRIGGEEFAILLPETTERQALVLAEALRTRFAMPAAAPHTTVSIGVATATKSDALDTLLQRADKALYDAKNAGRNSVRLYVPHQPSDLDEALLMQGATKLAAG